MATGTWPSWAAQGTLYYNGYECSVASRTEDNDIELDVAWDDDTVAGASYELRRVAYDLPDFILQLAVTIDQQHSELLSDYLSDLDESSVW